MRDINLIAVHCADTPAHMDIGAAEIRDWHTARGWSDIGYHYVIRRDGLVETGRPLKTPGAHIRGHNRNSIGICLVGGKGGANFTSAQYLSLQSLYRKLSAEFPEADWVGHRDIDKGKECPCFDVSSFLSTL